MIVSSEQGRQHRANNSPDARHPRNQVQKILSAPRRTRGVHSQRKRIGRIHLNSQVTGVHPLLRSTKVQQKDRKGEKEAGQEKRTNRESWLVKTRYAICSRTSKSFGVNA